MILKGLKISRFENFILSFTSLLSCTYHKIYSTILEATAPSGGFQRLLLGYIRDICQMTHYTILHSDKSSKNQ